MKIVRKDATRDAVIKAMADIADELDTHGVYLENGGKITISEVAKRAGIGVTTLRNPHHRDTRNDVKAWIKSLSGTKPTTKRASRVASAEKIQWFEEGLRKANASVVKLMGEVLDARMSGETNRHIQSSSGGSVVRIDRGASGKGALSLVPPTNPGDKMSSVKFKRTSDNSDLPLPTYASAGAAGMDLRACLPEGPLTFTHGDLHLVSTGFCVELPADTEMQVRPRSGMALKHGFIIPNSPGTIDEDYRGTVMVGLYYLGREPFVINHGDRIAQAVIADVRRYPTIEVEELTESDRGAGGFGSTGMK